MFPCILELLNQIVENIVPHKLFNDQINKTIICQEKLCNSCFFVSCSL